jgi:hypothetical protein
MALRPQKAAAEEVLEAAAKVAQGEWWLHSGYADHRASKLSRRARAKRKTPNRLHDSGFLRLCEEGDSNPYGS